MQKKEDTSSFAIPCIVGLLPYDKTLCDLCTRINVMSFLICMNLVFGETKPTILRLRIADRIMKRRIDVLHDVLVKVESFIFSVNFGILDNDVYFEVPIIIGRLFLPTGYSLVDIKKG